MMVTAEDMGGIPLEITALGFMPSEYSEKTGSYQEFTLSLGYTDLDELTMKFNENWSLAPAQVFYDPQVDLTNVTGGQWIMFEFSEIFSYDGSSTLLYELSWDGPVDPPDSRIYSMNWEDSGNSALVGYSPDSTSGYLTTVVPNLLFVTTQALEAQTFGAIKNSF
ncbi:MAG: hypothetical protein KAS73_07220 [Candidatus Sabulitectum sp.]|nr:hypothetical protein [Candidatus Sabulitectum sp.]